jgi:hypothetical protein
LKNQIGLIPLARSDALAWLAILLIAVAVLDMRHSCPESGRRKEKSKNLFRDPG